MHACGNGIGIRVIGPIILRDLPHSLLREINKAPLKRQVDADYTNCKKSHKELLIYLPTLS
jgi:hypothetical protein